MADIVIANTAEAFADLLERADTGSERALHEHDLAGRALFWGGREKVVVVPAPIDPRLVEHAAGLLRSPGLNIWSPSSSSLRLCADIMADRELFGRLEELAARGSRLVPYAVTPEFCALAERLGATNWQAALGAVTEVDSKVGFRRLFADSELALPSGWVCESADEVIARVADLTVKGRKAVVKVHDGESGWGLNVVGGCQATSTHSPARLIASLFGSDVVWERGPYIVEEFIDHDRAYSGFSPSGEATIGNDGVRFDFMCDQIVAVDGGFEGVRIGGEVETRRHAEAVKRQTLVVGEMLRARSYRGTFDVDFIVGRSGRLFAVESNVRITGGTHVHGAARGIYGDDWPRRSFASNDAVVYGDAPLPAGDLLHRLAGLSFDRSRERGVILSFVSARRPVVGVIAVAKDHVDALGLLVEARQALGVKRPGSA